MRLIKCHRSKSKGHWRRRKLSMKRRAMSERDKHRTSGLHIYLHLKSDYHQTARTRDVGLFNRMTWTTKIKCCVFNMAFLNHWHEIPDGSL